MKSKYFVLARFLPTTAKIINGTVNIGRFARTHVFFSKFLCIHTILCYTEYKYSWKIGGFSFIGTVGQRLKWLRHFCDMIAVQELTNEYSNIM